MKPRALTVIAGPNGSGKSTLTNYLIAQGVDFGRYINADELAKNHGLYDDFGMKAAQKLADDAREECLLKHINFSFETVMSHESKPLFMARAKAAGYNVTLFFVATENPEINLARVKARVALGGHNVPEDRIVARYWRSIDLLSQAILSTNRTVIFDNSLPGSLEGLSALRPVIEANCYEKSLSVEFIAPVPKWAKSALNFEKQGAVPWLERRTRTQLHYQLPIQTET